jgi:TetR/AcrR family transcriptional regulator of autoinduction and epiphytic fitness
VPGSADEPDGRVLRGRRNHEAVVGALLSLVADGDVKPTADAIAERAGLSRRSVFGHFADLEAIYEEAAERTWTKVAPLFESLDTSVALLERTEQFLLRRRQIFELLDPFARSARLREPISPQLRASRKRVVRQLRAQCRQAFGPELAADADGDLATAISAAASLAVWELLRDDLGLDRDHALHLIGRSVRGLLSTAVSLPDLEAMTH